MTQTGASDAAELALWDRDHVAFSERARGEMLTALRATKQFVAMYRNPNRMRGQQRLYGEVVALA